VHLRVFSFGLAYFVPLSVRSERQTLPDAGGIALMLR
jgi:hypothetical protein